MDLVSCLSAYTKAKVEDTSCSIMDTKPLNQEWLEKLILIIKNAEYLKTHLPKESPDNIEELKSEFRKYSHETQLTFKEILEKFNCFLFLIECKEVNSKERKDCIKEMVQAAYNLLTLARCPLPTDEHENLNEEICREDIEKYIENFIEKVAETKVPQESLEINHGCCYKLFKKEERVRREIIVRQVYSFSKVMNILFSLLATP